jgi:hypothetical protein
MTFFCLSEFFLSTLLIQYDESNTYIISLEKSKTRLVYCCCVPFFQYRCTDRCIYVYVTVGCVLLRQRTTSNNDVSHILFFPFFHTMPFSFRREFHCLLLKIVVLIIDLLSLNQSIPMHQINRV